MYEKPRGAFETLTQRMADACLATMPGFGPAPEAPADEAAQPLKHLPAVGRADVGAEIGLDTELP